MKKLIAPALLALLASSTALFAYRSNGGGKLCSPPSAEASQPTQADRAPRVAAEGRVAAYPGAEVVVGTDFAGVLSSLHVSEKSAVRKGDLLAEFDASEQKASLAEARAQIAEADADIKLGTYEVSRAQQMMDSNVGAGRQLEKARRDREAAIARRATAVARSERLAAVIAKARITAPLDGVVLARHAEAGETLDRGARVLTIADLGRLRVEAEVDEADSGRIELGAAVTVRAEGERGPGWRARVEEIPDAVTARKLKPQDPGKPSDTRVLLVKIALEEAAPLKLGRRVEVEIGGRS